MPQTSVPICVEVGAYITEVGAHITEVGAYLRRGRGPHVPARSQAMSLAAPQSNSKVVSDTLPKAATAHAAALLQPRSTRKLQPNTAIAQRRSQNTRA
eukprot:2817930-Rhodomonas_salina.2